MAKAFYREATLKRAFGVGGCDHALKHVSSSGVPAKAGMGVGGVILIFETGDGQFFGVMAGLFEDRP